MVRPGFEIHPIHRKIYVHICIYVRIQRAGELMSWGHNLQKKFIDTFHPILCAVGSTGRTERDGRLYELLLPHCLRVCGVRLRGVSSVPSSLPVETSMRSCFLLTTLPYTLHVTDTSDIIMFPTPFTSSPNKACCCDACFHLEHGRSSSASHNY